MHCSVLADVSEENIGFTFKARVVCSFGMLAPITHPHIGITYKPTNEKDSAM